MSVTAAKLARVPRSAPAARPKPQLTVVPAPKRRGGHLLYLAGLGLILAGSLTATLVLNTELTEGSFELKQLESQLAEAQARQVTLNEQLVTKTAPATLAELARAVGMVPAETTQHIILRDGAIVGAAPAEQTADAAEPQGEQGAGE